MKNQLRYKFLRTGLRSNSGNLTWKKGAWVHQDGTLSICHRGLHCSKDINQAFGFVQGEILAQVEVKGQSIIEDNKECWSDMRIVKAWKWEKKDSVSLAIYAAELVIDIYEKKYPNDDRPRRAIEAAKAYLKKPSQTADAAYAAADAAYAAADAAHATAYAAHATADAAHATAYAAHATAYAAHATAYAAHATAYAAHDRKELVEKIEDFMKKRIKKLQH